MSKTRVQSLGEFELIEEIRRIASRRAPTVKGLELGIGDDAAVLAAGRTVVTTDCFVEGVHFRRPWLSLAALGRRSSRAALSDLAAMGAQPAYIFLSLCLPDADFGAGALGLVAAFVRDVHEAGAQLAGGNITAARSLSVTVTAIGHAPRRLPTRDAARPGDLIFVTGQPGLAAAGLRDLMSGKRSGKAVQRWVSPPSLTELGVRLAKVRGLGAMIDLSDGLVQDLGHVARASRCRIRLDLTSLPVAPVLSRRAKNSAQAVGWVCAGGEDYELAFTARPNSEAGVRSACSSLGVEVAVIGVVEKGRAAVVDSEDHDASSQGSGYDHGPGRRTPSTPKRTK
jgi:thiamine-monophosphate kinase